MRLILSLFALLIASSSVSTSAFACDIYLDPALNLGGTVREWEDVRDTFTDRGIHVVNAIDESPDAHPYDYFVGYYTDSSDDDFLHTDLGMYAKNHQGEDATSVEKTIGVRPQDLVNSIYRARIRRIYRRFAKTLKICE
jgi:hypothetical protein